MKDLAIFTVIYPASVPFFSSFINSVKSQTDKGFELVILNDGVEDLESYLKEFDIPYHVIISPSSKPHENRIFALNKVKESFSKILFLDSDDELGPNRVEVVKSLLNDYDLVISDMDLVSENGQMITEGFLSKRLTNKQQINSIDLVDKNIAGFTNTAIKIPIGHEFPELPGNIKAVDWAVFHHLLLFNSKAIFTSDCTTKYRQYGSNLVGMNDYSQNMVIKSIQEKISHYEFMSQITINDKINYEGYLNYFNEIWNTKEKLNHYTNHILANKEENLFWWEIAKNNVENESTNNEK